MGKALIDIQRMKDAGKKGVMWVCWSYELARILDRAEPDMFLVGDSGSSWLLGHPDNNDTTVDEMIMMGRAVKRAAPDTPVIVDMPFMSYQTGIEDAIRNAGRIIKETRADGVKIEGDEAFAETVHALVRVGIPVMAHTGITPQMASALGGMHGGNTLPDEKFWKDVRALQDAGAFSIVLTGIPGPRLTEPMTKELTIPTIAGYLAGTECDILLGWLTNGLGFTSAMIDNSTAPYGTFGKDLYDAAKQFNADVRAGQRRTTPLARA